MARDAGAITLAITGSRKTDLAREAEHILEASVPSIANKGHNLVVPGTRSYIASLISLYLAAIHIGKGRGFLTPETAAKSHNDLAEIPDAMAKSIALNDEPGTTIIANQWYDAESFVFCGAGPSYGAALFSAAKIIGSQRRYSHCPRPGRMGSPRIFRKAPRIHQR